MTHPIEHPDAVERVDTAELRRLLEKADLELPLEAIEESCAACKREGKSEWAVSELVGGYHDMFGDEHQAKLIVAAVNALPALLSQLDKLETEKAEHVAGLKRFAQQLDGLHDLIIAAEASNASLVGALEGAAHSLEQPHEWGYRDPVVGGFIVDDTPFNVAQDLRHALSTLESGEAVLDWAGPLQTNETLATHGREPRKVRVLGPATGGAIDRVRVEIEDGGAGPIPHPPGEYTACRVGGLIRGNLAVVNAPADNNRKGAETQ